MCVHKAEPLEPSILWKRNRATTKDPPTMS